MDPRLRSDEFCLWGRELLPPPAGGDQYHGAPSRLSVKVYLVANPDKLLSTRKIEVP